MDTHKNASLTPRGREAMARSVVEGGLSKAPAAHQFNTTPKTVAKWVARFRAEGAAGPSLRTRSSRRDRPHRHQEARQIQSHRSPHHRRSHRPEQDPRDRLLI